MCTTSVSSPTPCGKKRGGSTRKAGHWPRATFQDSILAESQASCWNFRCFCLFCWWNRHTFVPGTCTWIPGFPGLLLEIWRTQFANIPLGWLFWWDRRCDLWYCYMFFVSHIVSMMWTFILSALYGIHRYTQEIYGNIASPPENRTFQKERIVFQPSLFRVYVTSGVHYSNSFYEL